MPMGKYMAQATGLYGYGWIFEIAILILFFLLVYWIINLMQKKESALDILNRRYASGEISKKEYISLKKEISGEKK
jgi:uncharacterized membrane protein